MKEILYVFATLSQFHQVCAVAIMSSIIVNLLKLWLKDKPSLFYQLLVVAVYILLEVAIDISIITYFIGVFTIPAIIQEIITIIVGIALTLTIYDTYHNIIKKIKEAKNG